MLRMEIVAEATREGDRLWRAEVTRDGVLVAASSPTVHPRAAIADGHELLAQARSDAAYAAARTEAHKLFAHAS